MQRRSWVRLLAVVILTVTTLLGLPQNGKAAANPPEVTETLEVIETVEIADTVNSTAYTINVRNLETDPVNMWLFLSAPEYSTTPKDVYKNSTTNLIVPEYNPQRTQKMIAKVQYNLQATQQSEPVQVGNQVISDYTEDVELNEGYCVDYSSEKGGFPTIEGCTTSQEPQTTNLVAQTNKFTPVQDYYNAMTFGIVTNTGTTGVTWVPRPNINYGITPTLTFFMGTGDYEKNELAEIDETSGDFAKMETGPGGNFDEFNNTWVTYNVDGTWTVDKKKWTD